MHNGHVHEGLDENDAAVDVLVISLSLVIVSAQV